MATTLVNAQARPSGASTAVSIYSPASGVTAVIKTIIVCNNTNFVAPVSADYSIYMDNDGTTYDETTSLHAETTLAAQNTVYLHPDLTMDNASGNLAVESTVGNALTFTVSLIEQT